MTDTEKAISLLQQCLDERPYAAVRVSQIMSCIQEAVELLKEQEPVKPIRVQREELLEENEVSTVTDVWAEWYCPKCHKKIAERYSPHAPYCMWCGQAVKWE